MITLTIVIGALTSWGLSAIGLLNKVGAHPLGFVISLVCISTVLATIIAYYVYDRVLKPLSALSDASKTVATGDFDVKIKLETDIEEINTTFENFNNMVTELNSIETLRNDFIANVSHEFKTPLSAIEGYTMLLQDENLSEQEKQEYIGKIIDNTRRLSSLTGDILLISKLENQTFSQKAGSFRLDEQIREAILTHELKWTEKEIELDIELDEIIYTGEESLLLQVWLNLIGNALKFTPEGGRVSVRLFEDIDRVIIEITDNGIGMDEYTAKHIFEKFYQGDTSHKSEGNGLGLALCKKIVERNGGSITVNTHPGQGTRFTVILPAK